MDTPLTLDAALEAGALYLETRGRGFERYALDANSESAWFCPDCGLAVEDWMDGCEHCGFDAEDELEAA